LKSEATCINFFAAEQYFFRKSPIPQRQSFYLCRLKPEKKMPEKITSSPIHRFRITALSEGISFLFLLFIAMPLKYFADMPLFVKYGGWVHGLLFVTYIFFLLEMKITYKWSLLKTAIAFAASLLPFGTFWIDNKWLKPLLTNHYTK
jgi:integral membrane protein